MRLLAAIWETLRQVMGDGAYERYCKHLRERHPGTAPPAPAEFYMRLLEARYSRPSRCC